MSPFSFLPNGVVPFPGAVAPAETAERATDPDEAWLAPPRSWRDEWPGYLFVAGFVLVAIGCGLQGSPSERCSIYPKDLIFGLDREILVAVKSGVACPISLETPAVAIDSLTIASSPHEGAASVTAPHKSIYQSRPGFRGDDDFSVAIRGKSPIFSGTSVVHVSIHVK